MSDIEFSLSSRSMGEVRIGGKDVSNYVKRITVDCSVGDAPVVKVYLIGSLGAFLRDADVVVVEEAAVS